MFKLLDYMEYSSDANAQAAYVTNATIAYGSDVTSGQTYLASNTYNVGDAPN